MSEAQQIISGFDHTRCEDPDQALAALTAMLKLSGLDQVRVWRFANRMTIKEAQGDG